MRFTSYTIASRDWGEIQVLRPIPIADDPWGALGALRGSDWEPLIPVVSKEVLEDAVRGYATPLMNVIGRPPDRLLKMSPAGICRKKGTCVAYHSKCKPGDETPDCYQPDEEEQELRRLITRIVLAWSIGSYVVVFEDVE